MSEQPEKGFFASKAFKLILVWVAMGIVLSLIFWKPGWGAKAMTGQCEAWAKHLEPLPHEEAEEHGESHHDPCHLVALHGSGFAANLAAAYHGMLGTEGKMKLATAWSIPNFLILITILWHFGKEPLDQTFKQRREEWENAIAEAKQARERAEALYQEYKNRLEQIDQELERIREELRAEAEAEKERLIAHAEDQARRIQNEAEFTAKQELLVARYKLREEAARLAVEIAEKVIKEVITDSDRERLIDEYLEKVMEQGQ